MNDKQLYWKLGRKVRELESDIADYLRDLEESVEERARELENANRKLKAEVKGRKKAQREIQKIKREWETTFDAMVDWVSLVELQLADGRWMMISIDPIVDVNNEFLNVVHICRDITERKSIEIEREKMVVELQTALADVKTLSGLLPICSGCKKIRDDKGYWNQIEAYIHKHSGTRFSHGICPECAKDYYPDLDLY